MVVCDLDKAYDNLMRYLCEFRDQNVGFPSEIKIKLYSRKGTSPKIHANLNLSFV